MDHIETPTLLIPFSNSAYMEKSSSGELLTIYLKQGGKPQGIQIKGSYCEHTYRKYTAYLEGLPKRG